jgi:hypothetical protein
MRSSPTSTKSNQPRYIRRVPSPSFLTAQIQLICLDGLHKANVKFLSTEPWGHVFTRLNRTFPGCAGFLAQRTLARPVENEETFSQFIVALRTMVGLVDEDVRVVATIVRHLQQSQVVDDLSSGRLADVRSPLAKALFDAVERRDVDGLKDKLRGDRAKLKAAFLEKDGVRDFFFYFFLFFYIL